VGIGVPPAPGESVGGSVGESLGSGEYQGGGVSSSRPGAVGTGSGFVWVATEGDQKVTPFTINLSSGSVSQVGSGIASGPNPRALAITPDSKEIFVANVDDTCGSGMFCNTVRQFTVNSDGSLTAAGNPAQITTPSSTALGMSMALAVDPTSAYHFHTGRALADADAMTLTLSNVGVFVGVGGGLTDVGNDGDYSNDTVANGTLGFGATVNSLTLVSIKDRGAKGQGFTHAKGDVTTISAPELGTLANRMTLSTEAPPWQFGAGALMRNLARRGLL
jgi:DNA-binding beta-propeller fold protein YncE